MKAIFTTEIAEFTEKNNKNSLALCSEKRIDSANHQRTLII